MPTEPILQARMEHLEQQGYDSFQSFSLPEAITRFKQGFGRLIRHNDDYGSVVVLDSRLIKKNYGQFFIRFSRFDYHISAQ